MSNNYVEADQLYVSPLNIRKTPPDPTNDEFTEFLESVRTAKRINDPLLVRPSPSKKTNDGRPMFEVFDGQCRLMAARMYGIKKLPVEITLEKDDAKLIQRSAFSTRKNTVTAWDWAATIRQLMEMEGNGQPRFPTHKDVANFLALSPARISMILKVAALPDEVKAKVLAGHLTHKAAERIAHGFPTPESQAEAAKVAVEAGLTQSAQVAAVEVVRDEPELLKAPAGERAAKVAEGTAKKRERAARKLMGAPAPADAEPVSAKEREELESLARDHGLAAEARQAHDVPSTDRATFEQLRSAVVEKVQEMRAERPPAERPPRVPSAEAIAAASSQPRVEAPQVFVTAEEIALVDELADTATIRIRLKDGIAGVPQEYEFSSTLAPGLRQAALLLLIAHWREAGLLDSIFQAHTPPAPSGPVESHASAEGRA